MATLEAPDDAVGDGDRNLGPTALASIASVALALYYYYVGGDKQRGQAVGLWPTTILGLSAYLKSSEIKSLLVARQD